MADLYEDRGQGRGLPADLQGLVNLTGIINREHANALKRKIKYDNGAVVYRGSNTETEFDIREDEFVVTPARTTVASHENVSQIPVLSSFAGKTSDKTKNANHNAKKREIMEKERFVGVAMQAVEMNGANRNMDVPRSKLAVQISGVFSTRATTRDMPFGARVRLDLPDNGERPRGFGTPNGIHYNKARLEMYPETDGKPFAAKMHKAIFDTLGLQIAEGYDTPDTPDQLVLNEFIDKLVNLYLMINRGLDPTGELNFPVVNESLIKQNLFAMFAMGSDGAVPVEIRDAIRLKGNWSESEKTEYYSAGSEFLTSLMDLVRYHNQWTIGTVIRPAAEGGRCDILM
jgi:hypothetical protein